MTEQISQIKKRLKNASEAYEYDGSHTVTIINDGFMTSFAVEPADADFLSHAKEDIEALLLEIEILQVELKRALDRNLSRRVTLPPSPQIVEEIKTEEPAPAPAPKKPKTKKQQ